MGNQLFPAGLNDAKAWSSLTLNFGWTGTAKYRKVGNRVDLMLDVECNNASAGTVIARMPSGYEPATRRFLTIGQTSGATIDQVWMDLQTDGDIEYDVGTPAVGDKLRGLTSYYLN